MKLPYNETYHIIPKQRIIVIWCAKAACTTVNCMYFDHENLLQEALKDTDWIHAYRKKYQKQQNEFREKYIQQIPPSRFIQFCVNPYRRAVSSYLHGMCRKYLPERHKNISFQDFLTRLHAGQIPSNPHHNLQTFYKNNYKFITTVKMEYLNDDLKKINRKFKLHFKPYNNQNMKKKSNKINYFIGNDKWEHFKDNIPNNYTLFYNATIKRLVEKIYGDDIQHLGYTWGMFVTYESNKQY